MNNIVNIESNGRVIGTSVTTAEGNPILGIRKATITLDARGVDVPVATLEIVSASLRVRGALPTFLVTDTKTGELKEVKRIEFADGTVFEA